MKDDYDNQSKMDWFFDTDENLIKKIIQEIRKSEDKIFIMHFWFTWKPIADELIKKEKKGVEINILVDQRSIKKNMEDKNKSYQTSLIEYLFANGIENIKIHCGPLLHHKVIVTDKTILTGSLNLYKESIEIHKENLLIIKDESDLLNKFKKEFFHIYNQSKNVEKALKEVKSEKNRSLIVSKTFETLKNVYFKVTQE